MTGAPPPSAALVTALRWKNGSGLIHTTLVAKLTMQLQDDGRASLVQPEPFVAFDRLAADPRFVAEASELMPWTTVASFVAYGGPLRFILTHEGSAAVEAPLLVELPEQPHPGISMSSPDRGQLAPRRPTRGADGVLTIPDEIDGRYFVAAPRALQFAALRGDEHFSLELTGWCTERSLPGMVVEVTLQLGSQRRVVSLTADMIVLDVASRLLSIVSRALVQGEAALLSHAVQRVGRGTSNDRGDVRLARGSARSQYRDDSTALLGADEVFDMSLGAEDETRDVSAAELAGLSAPFALEPASARVPHAGSARPLPATPFDIGFAPQPVQPGIGVLATLSPDEEMAQKLDQMRRQLRAQPAPGAAPPDAARVAPPKPGAMAKPRFKRR